MDSTSSEIESKKKLVMKLCICQGCPTYVSCGELGFCFQTVGKSKCIKRDVECICKNCQATKKFGLQNVFYCRKGSEKTMTGGKNFSFQ